MTITRDIIVRELKFGAVVTIASVIQAYLMCPSCDGFSEYFLVTSFNLALYVVLWRGNAFLAEYLSCTVGWVERPARRFFIGLATTVGYTLGATFIVILVYERFLGLNFGSSYQLTIVIVLAGTFLISLFMHSREFLNSWRKAAVEAERLQRESVSARYENLKTRINPAFLFQSLGDLERLVIDDEEKAVVFIKRLSDVYRYILDTRDREVVSIAREEKFLRDYLFLVGAHYGDCFEIELQTLPVGIFVPPLAIQMIIESNLTNARFDVQRPFRLAILTEAGGIVVRQSNAFLDSHARERYLNVIAGIRDRFSFLSSSQFEIEESNDQIVLKFPVIEGGGTYEN